MAYAGIFAAASPWLFFPHPDLGPYLVAIWLSAGAYLAFRDRLPARWRRPAAVVAAPFVLAAVALFAFSVFLGGGFLTFVSWPALAVLVGVGLGGLGARFVLWRLRPSWRPVLRLVFATCVLMVGMAWYATLAVIMRPVSPTTCAEVAADDRIEQVSPPGWVAEYSMGSRLLVLPERRLLIATFRPVGSFWLPFWCPTGTMRLAVFDLDAPPGERMIQEIPLPDDKLAEEVVYDAERQHVLVLRNGRGAWAGSVSVFRLDDADRLHLVRHVPVPDPNDIAIDEARDRLYLFGQTMKWVMLDAETFESRPLKEIDARLEELTLFNVLDTEHLPGTPYTYLSFVGTGIAVVDMRNRELQASVAGFGGGDLEAVPSTGHLLQTDGLQGALRVFRLDDLELVESKPLDYTPRPVMADPARELFVLGSWLPGEIHTYDLGSLREYGEPIPIGPYVRKLAFDRVTGDLYATSKCGVMRVDGSALEADEPTAGRDSAARAPAARTRSTTTASSERSPGAPSR
ncbi:MAG: hypothetical protein ACQEXJ_22035 [Myxococcota bacterium]